MEKGKNTKEIEIDKLIIRVHNKIAIWNNQDVPVDEKSHLLRLLSHEIVTEVITEAFRGLDGAKIGEKVLPSASQSTKKRRGLFKYFF